MADSSNKIFHANIKKLHSLRDKLCNQQSSQSEAFKVKDFVVSELQELHQQLNDTQDSPDWCKKKVEHILNEILALTADLEGE